MRNPVRRVIEWSVALAPGETADITLLLPFGLVPKETAESILGLDSGGLFTEVSAFWRNTISGAASITTPDSFVNDYVAAVVGQMAQQVGLRHKKKIWMYKTAPNWYEDYYPANAAKPLPVLDMRGLTHISRPVYQSFIDFQTDDPGLLGKSRNAGAPRDEFQRPTADLGEGFERRPGLLGNFGGWTANLALMCHGAEMWALAAHYRITRDRAWLGSGPGSPLHAILEGFDWVSAQRRRTMREEGGRRVAHWGLLPAASAHDWLSGNSIVNDCWVIYGMIEAVRLLREIDHPRAEALARELNEYRSCLRERYREARDRAKPLPVPGGEGIPYVPRDISELDWAKPDWTYYSYGPARAGGQGALDPFDELTEQALRFLDVGRPTKEGREYFQYHRLDRSWVNTPDTLAPKGETHWPMYEIYLQRDDLDKFFELFFHTLASSIHHEFRVGCEGRDGIPSTAPSDGEHWRMVRSAFVNERGGYDGSQQSLWLLQAIPRSWLKPGDHLAVKDMGTHFGGRVGLVADVARDGRSVIVAAELDLAVSPTEIRLRLRSGDGRPLASAHVNGEKVEILSADTIRLPVAKTGAYRIVGRF